MTVIDNLVNVSVGETVTIMDLDNPDTALMALRLGICCGEVVQLTNKVPGGPLIVSKGAVEIALGRALCADIKVQRSVSQTTQTKLS